MSRAPSRAGSGRKRDANSSSSDRPGGLVLGLDPTLPSTQQAVKDSAGKRVGVVKRVGTKFAHSRDDFGTKFASPQAALRAFSGAAEGKPKDAGSDTGAKPKSSGGDGGDAKE